MATEAATTDRGGKAYRLTVRQFLEMIRQGIFPEDVQIELLRGILIEHPKRTPQHDACITGLSDQLRTLIPESWLVREQKSLELGRTSRIGPDIALIRGPGDLDRTRGPRAEEVGFLIEVADSTYAYARGVKWRAYASSLIPIYWIVNLPKRQIELYRDPQGRGKTATYRESTLFGPGSEIPVMLESREIGRIAVKDILP